MGEGAGHGPELVRHMQAAMAEHAEELTSLDRAIGDGDHGTNMHRGMDAALSKVESLDDQSLATVLRTVATTLISTVGGAAGPLYGTGFLRAATVLDGNSAVTPTAIADAFDAFVEGVKQRGKATAGEKTMLDALIPAAEALRAAIDEGATVAEAFSRAAEAARQGMEATIPMVATKGRASYLGERSVGHQDPGATSSYYLLQAISEALAAGS
jgi:dihydroxyacetone kinase-like protein